MTAGRRDDSSEAGNLAEAAPRIAELEPLVDERVGVGRDFAMQSKTIFIVFSTISEAHAPPPFEFLAASSRVQVRRLFVRDVKRVWYHHGVPGLGNRVDVVAKSLRAILDEQGAERVVVIGYSAGGYAALLFGALLSADLVFSLEPQTCIDRGWLAEIGDERWTPALDRLDGLGGADERYVDLREVLARERRGETRYELHYNALFEADEQHAGRLEGIPGLELHRREPDGLNIVRSLRRSGELERIFGDAVGDQGS